MFNTELMTTVINALLALSGWEVFAALLGIGYVILAARESQWCWPFAFVSTLIYTLLFWEGQLPMQAILNVYYMGMAVYGYLLWKKQDNSDELPITSWSFIQQIQMISIGILLSYAVARYLEHTGASINPYLDASATVFAVINTYLMANKVLQNWFYWIVIDAASIMLYAQNSYYATVVMYSVYLILAVIGLISWQRLYRQQSQ